MFPIPWNRAFRKKDGTLVNMEDLAGGGSSELPEHSASDAGKLLGIADDNSLAWISASSLHMYEVTTNQYIALKMFVLTTVNEASLNTMDKLMTALTTGIGFVVKGQVLGTTHVPVFAKHLGSDSDITVYYTLESVTSDDIWGRGSLSGHPNISSTKLF